MLTLNINALPTNGGRRCAFSPYRSERVIILTLTPISSGVLALEAVALTLICIEPS
jgi:hypothetical protein